MSQEISQETIEKFLNGADPEKYITSLEYDYGDNFIYKMIQDPIKGKIVRRDSFTAFLWCGDLNKLNFYKNDKTIIQQKMLEYGITIRKLETYDNNRLDKGLKYLVKTSKTYSDLINFFKKGGLNPWGEKVKQHFQVLNPVEQYLIQKGKRLFKGFENYDDIHRLVFDIETTGLDPETCKIILIGVKDNRGFRKTISALGEDGEQKCIEEFFECIRQIKPSIIGGYNSASFDFPFIIKRAEKHKMDIRKMTQILSNVPIKRKDGVLKLASEVESFNQYLLWGFNIIDISHSVRRAQAMNSEIKGWGLKYVTKYLEKEKPNRVYVDGAFISKIYLENKDYYFNPKTGNYREVGTPGTENLMEKFPGKFEIWTGKQIVEQYLDDDLYETMIVDESFGLSTFLLSKLMPTSFERISTMGTASLWKMIMLEWSYQNNLAIPQKEERRSITGGLSRLVNAGFAKNIVKFDFRSLYPSIDLLYRLFPECDVTGALKYMLKYFRDTRIRYKELMGELKESDPVMSEMYDRKQLPIKIFINAFFGSLSAPHVFPWAEMDLGEMTTCIGRQSLRQMLMFYEKKNYKPLVMDSVEYDTPVYLKDRDENMVILPICDLYDENSLFKCPEGLRDFSKKNYSILTKNGWKEIIYVYKHETNKPIHKLTTKDRLVCCTSDHSVFQNYEQIKPTELNRGDAINIVEIPKLKNKNVISKDKAKLIGFFIGDGSCYYKKRKQTRGKYSYNAYGGGFELNNSRIEILEEFQKILKNEYNIDSKINDCLKSSSVYKLETANAELCKWFSKNCYTSYRQKMIPFEILNSSLEILTSFMEGFYLADGWGDDFNIPTDITQKSKVCVAGLTYILKTLGVDYKINIRKDKPNIQSLIMGTSRNNKYYKINSDKSKRRSDEIWSNVVLTNNNRFVFDISTEDGTFVGGIGGILLKNTDGVNFEIPEDIETHTYVGKGLCDLVKEGKEYKGIEADTAEFNDLFMRDEMGLDIDYTAPSCINLSRKNYIIKMEKKGKTIIKLTGNSIKSKKIPQYISEFFDEALIHLLNDDGHKFLSMYYDTIQKIYDRKIPLIKIANRSKVKMSVNEYKEHTKKKTKSGADMSRQAHMELIIQNNYLASLGETIYYVNNGKKASDGDVKKIMKWEGPAKKKDRLIWEEEQGRPMQKILDKIEINAYMLDAKELEQNPDKIGEYNVDKYIAAFNKKIEPLLVAFHPDIREEILIKNPQDRAFFTPTQCKLVNGYPLDPKKQDDMEDVMTLSDTEVLFWNKMGLDPFMMYIDNTLELADQYYVEKNRKVLALQLEASLNNEDEEIIDNEDGQDYAVHTVLYK